MDRAGLLPASYLDEPDQFHLRSDNARRTDQSGQALFTGLYPPESDALASPEAASDPSYVPCVCVSVNNVQLAKR